MGLGAGAAHASREADISQENLAQSQQKAHDANVAAGQTAIDSAFSQFTPDYYSGLQKAYTDYYQPQAQTQYNNANRDLTYQQQDNGTIGGTGGDRELGDLAKDYATTTTGIANAGQQAVDQRQQQVADEKTNLYGLNESAADPASASANAIQETGTLSTPLPTSPLGDLFGSAIQSAGSTIAGAQMRGLGMGLGYGALPGAGGVASGSGSASVIS